MDELTPEGDTSTKASTEAETAEDEKGDKPIIASSETADDIDDVPEPSRLGTCIGLYELVRRHGHGGMGVVYEAVQKNIGKRVAVKFLSARLSRRASARDRFLQEARAGAKVSHPGLVQIFDHGSLPDGTPYILMEFLDGQSLRTYLGEFPLRRTPLASALHWGRQVASALAAAHATGIVHRDLKPENLMMVSDPEALGGKRLKVLDFGIAKFLQLPDPRSRPSRHPLGTSSYMSPEQCRGDENIDGRSDVYSLGIVLYEMLCGRPPFQKDPRDPDRVRYQQVFADPPHPRSIRPDLPERVAALLLRMLSKAKETRPTMSELDKSLAALLRLPGIQPSGTSFALSRRMPILLLTFVALAGAYFYQRFTAGMVLIWGAEFQMGSTQQQALAAANWARATLGCNGCEDALYLRETPQHPVKVASFFLDTHEVTNQEFAEWLRPLRDMTSSVGIDSGNRQRCEPLDSSCAKPQQIMMIKVGGTHIADIDMPSDARYRTRGLEWKDGRIEIVPDMARKPVVNVTWEGAFQYCVGHGKLLPSEAEWELAARGPQGRQFPWGDQKPVCGQLTLGWSGSCKSRPIGPVDVASPSLDQTPEGVYDLGGNVAEWVGDFFRLSYQPNQDSRALNEDSKVDAEAGRRVVRGGSWSNEPDASRGAARSRWAQDGTSGDIGFRCARPLILPRL